MSERILSASAALAEALHEEMARDASVYIVGEDLMFHSSVRVPAITYVRKPQKNSTA